MTLKGKVALVTGSGRNIGRATALELARQGAKVVVNSRQNLDEANSVSKEINDAGGTSIAVLGDVGVEEEVQNMFDIACKELGPVTILVNNAGLRGECELPNMTTEEWRRLMAVNLDGPFFCSRAAIPNMIANKWGRIINVSGMNAFKGRSGWGHVSASKMGALGLTRALSAELAPHGILVNIIVPGAFDTFVGNEKNFPAPQLDNIPLQRLGLPEEIGKTCAFLASDNASYITGQTLHVNGGALTY